MGCKEIWSPHRGAKGKTRKKKSKLKKKGLSSSGDQVTASHIQGVDSPATQVPWEEWYPNVCSMLLITPIKSISTLSSSQEVNIFMATAISHGNPSRHQLLNFSEEGTHFPWLPAVPGYTLKNDTEKNQKEKKKKRRENLSAFLLTCRSWICDWSFSVIRHLCKKLNSQKRSDLSAMMLILLFFFVTTDKEQKKKKKKQRYLRPKITNQQLRYGLVFDFPDSSLL